MIFHIFSVPFLQWVFGQQLFKVLRKKDGIHCSDFRYVHTYTFPKRSVFEKIRFGVSTRIVRQSGDPVHTDVD